MLQTRIFTSLYSLVVFLITFSSIVLLLVFHFLYIWKVCYVLFTAWNMFLWILILLMVHAVMPHDKVILYDFGTERVIKYLTVCLTEQVHNPVSSVVLTKNKIHHNLCCSSAIHNSIWIWGRSKFRWQCSAGMLCCKGWHSSFHTVEFPRQGFVHCWWCCNYKDWRSYQPSHNCVCGCWSRWGVHMYCPERWWLGQPQCSVTC